MRKAILTAQRTADNMIAEAERKAAEVLNNAQATAEVKTVDTAAITAQADAVVRAETERMNNAKRTALNFIEVLEQDIKGHLDLLAKLKAEDLTIEEVPAPAPVRQKPFNYEEAEERPLVVPKAAETPADIAHEIEQNITRLMDISEPVEAAEEPRQATDATIKFTNLQFGRNYDPTVK